MYFCQWDFRGLIMMVGYSDWGQDEAIAKLHGKGSEWYFNKYATNFGGLAGGSSRGIQACFWHPLSHCFICW